MKQLEMLYEGKAKQVFRTDDPDKIIIHYKDAATAFNNIKKATIENKGVLNNAISTLIFKELQKSGVKTHYIETINDRDQVCRRVTIIPAGGDRAQCHRRFDGPAPRYRGGYAAVERHLRHLLQEGRAGRPADQRPPRRGIGCRDLRGTRTDLRHDLAYQRDPAQPFRQDEHQTRGLQDRGSAVRRTGRSCSPTRCRPTPAACGT